MEGESDFFAARARQCVEWHFYVDGSLKYFPTVTEAIDVLRTGTFPTKDLVNGLHDLDSGKDVSTNSDFTCMRLMMHLIFAPSTKNVQGGHVNSKHWAAIVTCTGIQARQNRGYWISRQVRFHERAQMLHMLSEEQQNRGSNCDTNSVGAIKELKTTAKRCTNHPHSSHIGGNCEQMFGFACQMRDSSAT